MYSWLHFVHVPARFSVKKVLIILGRSVTVIIWHRLAPKTCCKGHYTSTNLFIKCNKHEVRPHGSIFSIFWGHPTDLEGVFSPSEYPVQFDFSVMKRHHVNFPLLIYITKVKLFFVSRWDTEFQRLQWIRGEIRLSCQSIWQIRL